MFSCPMQCMFLTGEWSQRGHHTEHHKEIIHSLFRKIQKFIQIVVRVCTWVELRQSMFQDRISSNYYSAFFLHAMSHCGSIDCIMPEADYTAPPELQFFVTLTRHPDIYMSKYWDHVQRESKLLAVGICETYVLATSIDHGTSGG